MSELKATAHILTFEPGTYCVFPTPGGPAPRDGLPATRVSAGPGAAAGAVSFAGLAAEGWLVRDGDATLVRVEGGPAPVLVTVYQAEGAGEPPKLQIMRLSAPETVSVEVLAHQFGAGDVGARWGEWVGTRGSGRWLEGFAVLPPAGVGTAELEYQAVLGRDWLSPWSEGGQFCGSRGMSLPVLGLRVRLLGAAAGQHEVAVAATFVDGTTAGPVTDAVCAAESLAALEAFQLMLRPKAATKRRRAKA